MAKTPYTTEYLGLNQWLSADDKITSEHFNEDNKDIDDAYKSILDTINRIEQSLTEHIINKANPHKVSNEQVGAPSVDSFNELQQLVQDIIDSGGTGEIPFDVMRRNVYDTEDKRTDVYKYVDEAVEGVQPDMSGLAKGDDDGNALKANQLTTARKIALTGGITGEAKFDGSKDIEIAVGGGGLKVEKWTPSVDNFDVEHKEGRFAVQGNICFIWGYLEFYGIQNPWHFLQIQGLPEPAKVYHPNQTFPWRREPINATIHLKDKAMPTITQAYVIVEKQTLEVFAPGGAFPMAIDTSEVVARGEGQASSMSFSFWYEIDKSGDS